MPAISTLGSSQKNPMRPARQFRTSAARRNPSALAPCPWDAPDQTEESPWVGEDAGTGVSLLPLGHRSPRGWQRRHGLPTSWKYRQSLQALLQAGALAETDPREVRRGPLPQNSR